MSTSSKQKLTLTELSGILLSSHLVLALGTLLLTLIYLVAGALQTAGLTPLAGLADLVGTLWVAYLIFSVCYAQVHILPCILKIESRSGVSPSADTWTLGLAGLRWGLFCHAVPTLRLLAMARRKPDTPKQ